MVYQCITMTDIPCVYIISVDSDMLSGVKSFFGSGEKKELVDPYLSFQYAGQEVHFVTRECCVVYCLYYHKHRISKRILVLIYRDENIFSTIILEVIKIYNLYYLTHLHNHNSSNSLQRPGYGDHHSKVFYITTNYALQTDNISNIYLQYMWFLNGTLQDLPWVLLLWVSSREKSAHCREFVGNAHIWFIFAIFL